MQSLQFIGSRWLSGRNNVHMLREIRIRVCHLFLVSEFSPVTVPLPLSRRRFVEQLGNEDRGEKPGWVRTNQSLSENDRCCG